ncbi:MAG: hypothetical protein V8T12_00530 [Parabacteroides johnsonii]
MSRGDGTAYAGRKALEAVEFFDVTDRFNTLVHPVHALSYRDCLYRQIRLFAENTEKEAGFFMLKNTCVKCTTRRSRR